MYTVKISVRNLVESILLAGDIGTGMMILSPERAEEGSRVHRLHQKNRQEKAGDYLKEYYLKTEYSADDIKVIIDGRADGVLPWDYIEEIKSTYQTLSEIEAEDYPLHWAQLKFYGYMAVTEQNLEGIDLKLTYFHIGSEEFRSFDRHYTKDELTEFTEAVLLQFIYFKKLYFKWMEKRNLSIKLAGFPFSNYRPGQREMAVAIYGTIRENQRIFIQAPTGTGKTISALFPAVKALREGKTDRIFYLTPKGTGKAIGEESVRLLREQGASLRSITLTSKEKICFMEEVNCDADYCPYAKGHFDRVLAAVADILENEDSMVREKVEAYARKHMVCPFEYSLDLSLYADIIIGDYNYAFDPRVYLKRFFDERLEKYVFLIDEAHNLLDRSRAMFSASLQREPFKILKKDLKPYSPEIRKAAEACAKALKELGAKGHDAGGNFQEKDYPPELLDLTDKFCAACEKFFSDEAYQGMRLKLKTEDQTVDELLLNTYFECLSFRRIAELYNEGYLTYVTNVGGDVRIKLFCIDPAENLRSALGRADAAVFFSATLTPMDYYIDLYGGTATDYRMMLASPFDKDHLQVYCDWEVDTRYKYREFSFEKIADNIAKMLRSRVGNYIAFFPSYKYMGDALDRFETKYGGEFIIKRQESGLREEDREGVLNDFLYRSDRSMVYFMVMGGIFAEGIDLKGDSLIGAALVGVGYPQFDYERQLILDYFEELKSDGFKYAYTYPGLNKITQAGGRVIRSETDLGIILLMDKRYKNRDILKLLPADWLPLKDISALGQGLEWERIP